MQIPEFLMIFSDPAYSAVFWAVSVPLVLYMSRAPAHRAIIGFGRVVHFSMRLSAKAVLRGEKVLMERNREVLLAAGRESCERIIEREFDRVDATVRNDLAEYPALHRRLSEHVNIIDEHYGKSTEVPPEPPGWVKAVEAVAHIEVAKGDPTVANILDDIHSSLKKASAKASTDYRTSSQKRHEVLNQMMPHWRKLLVVLEHVDTNVNTLLERSKIIDRHMDDYENIVKQTDRALRMVSSSSITQFFISGLVLCIAIGGAMINFQLIALPMSEMVGAKSQLFGFPISEVAALVIILVEISLGLFLMESMRITRLFPVIGALNDKMRVKMIWVTFTFLLSLASVESGLAYMREILAEQNSAVTASLIANGSQVVVDNSMRWITTAAQMGLGFILPFSLVLVAIPLESFIESFRTVMGVITVAVLRTLAVAFRVIGNVAQYTSRALIHAYDMIIFVPLWVEGLFFRRKGGRSGTQPAYDGS